MKVKAIRDCYVDRLRREGEEFDYNGPKNGNLQPLDGAKWPAAKADAKPAASAPKPAAPVAGVDAKPADSEPAK